VKFVDKFEFVSFMSYLVGLQSLRVPTFYPLNTKTVITSDHIPSLVGHCFTFDFAYVSLDSIYIINQHLYGMTMEIVSVGATKVAGFEYNRSCSKIQFANHQRRDLGASSASFVCYAKSRVQNRKLPHAL